MSNAVSTLFAGGEQRAVGQFVSPFTAKGVNRIWIMMDKRAGDVFEIRADIHFCAGRTTGEHRVVADTLEELLPKLRAFVDGLPE